MGHYLEPAAKDEAWESWRDDFARDRELVLRTTRQLLLDATETQSQVSFARLRLHQHVVAR